MLLTHVIYFIRNSIGITLEHVLDRFNARLDLRNQQIELKQEDTIYTYRNIKTI